MLTVRFRNDLRYDIPPLLSVSNLDLNLHKYDSNPSEQLVVVCNPAFGRHTSGYDRFRGVLDQQLEMSNSPTPELK